MDAHEIVEKRVERDHVDMAFKALAESIGQAREAAIAGQSLAVLHYSPDEESAPIALSFDGPSQGIWATQEQIAALFGVDRTTVVRHIRNVFNDEEVPEESNVQKTHIANSDKPVRLYSLDVIISVGYRVNSKTATRFRQWATQTLTTYLEQGYVLNDKVLRDYPEKLNKLAAEVRALRSSEKHIYAKVRDCFKISASDYNPQSDEVRTFYALLQDKFHHAVTRLTSSKLILDRAKHGDENMGLQSFDGDKPTKADAIVGKNYLRSDELYRLHLLCEQFLLFAESTALSEKKMTMDSLRDQLDRLLTLNDYPVLGGYQDYLRKEAIAHAEQELRLFKLRGRVEAAGLTYDAEGVSYGEYDDFLEDDERPKPVPRNRHRNPYDESE